MTRIHVLTPGFTTPNGAAFLFPILLNRGLLSDLGYRIDLFAEVSPGLLECDVLGIDSKYCRARWKAGRDEVLDELGDFKDRVDTVIFFDTSDSSGTLVTQVLPHVHAYYKSQLLRDRALYQQRLYRSRLFTHYYHNRFGVEDKEGSWSVPIEDQSLLSKLGVSWNSGLCDYSLTGPYRLAIYGRLGWRPALRQPRRFDSPTNSRPADISCRMSVEYPDSVAYQRVQVREHLKGLVETEKIPRRPYFNEMRRSKIILAPFGWGETTLRDFEGFICGGLLLKPDMSHIETYPDIYKDGLTMVAHRWDLSDLKEKIDLVLGDYSQRLEIAKQGQETYRKYAATASGREGFALHFDGLIRKAAEARL